VSCKKTGRILKNRCEDLQFLSANSVSSWKIEVSFYTTVYSAHKYIMRIQEITSPQFSQPLTPAQAKIDALKQQKERASTALKAERERQQRTKAKQNIQNAQQALNKIGLQ
jgi:hypothetical protein